MTIAQVVGDAGTLIDPDDRDAWTEAVSRALTDTVDATARQKAIARAAYFRWENAAAEYVSYYRHAMACN